jgi:prephenate dehydrogenase
MPDVERIGVDYPETLVRAHRRQIIHRGHGPADLAEAVSDADLTFISTPIPQIIELLPKIVSAANSGSLITDTGSVKGPILDAALSVVDSSCHFVGGHPMAGSEQSGIGFADSRIMKGAHFATVPLRATPPEVVEGYEEFLRELGFQPMRMTAAYHDRVVATISHVPHLAAAALLRCAGEVRKELTGLLQLAGKGFSDVTRIGGCDPELWAGICRSNRPQILESLKLLEEEIRSARQAVEDGDTQPFFESSRLISQELERVRNRPDDFSEF